MEAPHEHNRLLTGAYLALAGVAIGAGVAWAFMRPGPAASERTSVVIVPLVPVPVAAATPSGVMVYPSSAFTPVNDGQNALANSLATGKATVDRPVLRENGPRPMADRPDPVQTSSSRSEVLIYSGVSSAFTILPPIAPSGTGRQINSPDDALSFALEAIDRYIKQGYTLREDTWGGDLPVDEGKAITLQLFKGNDYRFCMGTSAKGARIYVHIYDGEGNLAEDAFWQRDAAKGEGAFACASIDAHRTGTYFLIVKVEQSPEERTPWSLVYAYK